MEEEVCAAGFERAAGAALVASIARREREAKAIGAGPEPGPAHPLGDCRKNCKASCAARIGGVGATGLPFEWPMAPPIVPSTFEKSY